MTSRMQQRLMDNQANKCVEVTRSSAFICLIRWMNWQPVKIIEDSIESFDALRRSAEFFLVIRKRCVNGSLPSCYHRLSPQYAKRCGLITGGQIANKSPSLRTYGSKNQCIVASWIAIAMIVRGGGG